MATEFVIQARNPRGSFIFNPTDGKVSEAMETAFSLMDECAFLIWRSVCVPLSYKYDLSVMIDDLFLLMSALVGQGEGRQKIAWASNTFAATWDVQWAAGRLEIDAKWDCLVGGVESILASKPRLTLSVSEFLAEWRRPLEVIVGVLERAGYRAAHLVDFEVLQSWVQKLGRGQLYDHGVPGHGAAGTALKTSWHAPFQDDLFTPFGNGYDGVLESFKVGAAGEALSAEVVLRLCSSVAGVESWWRLRIEFLRLQLLHVEAEWFDGGGGVLYDGARLLRGPDGRVVLDLDPGVAWLTTSAELRGHSRFILDGVGIVESAPILKG